MNLPWINTTLVHPKISGGIHVVRFLTAASVEPHAPFEGVCTVDTTGKVARIYGMCGRVNRRHLRALMDWFLEMNVWEIRAHRAPLRILPGAKREGDWMVIDLFALKQRV